MSFVPAAASEYRAPIVANTTLSRRYFMMRVARPEGFPDVEAGAFVHMAVPEGGRFFLRRPFSIFDLTTDTIDLLIVEHGPGTRILRRMAAGEHVDFYGPLGHGFPRLPDQRILAIGGGVGLAPLYLYGFRAPAACGANYRLLYGARTAEDLFLESVDWNRAGVRLATDDGSHGFRGNAIELARDELERDGADVIFSCGPTPMMKAADALATELGVRHYASLENRMGCALGACRACVVPTRLGGPSPYRTVCHDGPVFDGASLVWDELPVP